MGVPTPDVYGVVSNQWHINRARASTLVLRARLQQIGSSLRRDEGLFGLSRVRGVDLDAGSHGGTDRHAEQVTALGARGLGSKELFDDGVDVGDQLLNAETGLADAQMNVSGFVGAVLDAKIGRAHV